MAETAFDGRVAAVRRFNRFYTRQVGLLRDGYLGSDFSLAEARVLYELAHRQRATPTELVRELGLDPGYLSRIVRRFETRRLLARSRSASDGRRSMLALTSKGRQAFAPLQRRSHDEIAGLLRRLSETDQQRLVTAMGAIERVLGAGPEPKTSYLIRTHQPGDLGWIVYRHGAVYAQEYGWDERFEALVAKIAARFIERYDDKRERCWLAERDGEIVGSVMLVKKSATVAQLRLLLVEPTARGLGIGARLVDECIRFARRSGYRKISLWTQSVLVSARKIYAAAGFEIVHKERYEAFGAELTSETWDLTL